MSSKELFIFMIHLTFVVVYSHPPCGLYGAPPCQFVPAPPGHTPSCARPGKTYCEHIEHYPTHLIKHLVHKWGYESKNLIIDETGEEFESIQYHRHHDPVSHFYHPSAIFGPPSANHLGQFEGYKYDPPNQQHGGGGYHDGFPEPIYIPKPRDTDYAIYSSITSPHFNKNNNQGYHYGPKVSHYNPADWLKRYARDLARDSSTGFSPVEHSRNVTRSTPTRGFSHRRTLLDMVPKTERSRVKRQSPGRSTLCQVTSQFITPQAALSSKGNWMYVVNDVDTARQLVKTELCASSVCSNLCQLPNGYNSRCEQKYVQKRLVALNGNGQNLYTDTFWFPSCCVCTLSN